VLAALVAVELLYLVAVHAVLLSGVIQKAVSADPSATTLGWDRAWSPWPARVYVTNLHLQVQDQTEELALTVEHAKVDVVLWDLLRRKFRASRVEARGVSYRMALKVKSVRGNERRLAAFPPLDDARPPLLENPPPPPATSAEIARLWKFELDHVDATIDELWFLEYRYLGPAHVTGGFALDPLRRLWVGPATLWLQGGKLTAGHALVSSRLTGRLDVTVTPTDLPSAEGWLIFRGLSAKLDLDTAIDDLAVADLYVDGLRTRGTGRLSAKMGLASGQLVPGSTCELSVRPTDLAIAGYRYQGTTRARFLVPEDGGAALASATLEGVIDLPWFGEPPARAAVSDVTGHLTLQDDDLTRGLRVRRIRLALADAQIRAAQPIAHKAGDYLPVGAPLLLGDGPLVASARFEAADRPPLVRLDRLTLGEAELHGAAVAGHEGWNGSGEGHLGPLPFGVRVQDSRPQIVLFPGRDWLASELSKLGIRQETGRR